MNMFLCLALLLNSWLTAASPTSRWNLTSNPLFNNSAFYNNQFGADLGSIPEALNVTITAATGPLSPPRAFMTAITMVGLLALGDFDDPMPMSTAHYRETMDDDLTITVSSVDSVMPMPRGMVLWATKIIIHNMVKQARFCFCEAEVSWDGGLLGTISFAESSKTPSGMLYNPSGILYSSTSLTLPSSSQNRSLATTLLGNALLDWTFNFNSSCKMNPADVFAGTLSTLIYAAQSPPHPLDRWSAFIREYSYFVDLLSCVRPNVLDKAIVVKTLVAAAFHAREADNYDGLSVSVLYGGRIIARGAYSQSDPGQAPSGCDALLSS